MSSIFTKIINGKIPSYKVAENEKFYAFLDINPNSKGHTLVVPKKEEDRIFDMDEDDYLSLMYKTSEKGIMQDEIIKITDNKLYLLELKHSWKYSYMQDIVIWNKDYWYLIFLREKNDFSENEMKIISTLSLSFGWLLKQKELMQEQKNRDYIKNS